MMEEIGRSSDPGQGGRTPWWVPRWWRRLRFRRVPGARTALLIDFASLTIARRWQTELKRLLQSDILRGEVVVKRAYADWRRHPHRVVPLSDMSIDLIHAPTGTPGTRNAAAARLALDATELVFTRPEMGTFVLVSADPMLVSLAIKLREHGKYVIGVGPRESASDLWIQSCDEYYSYTALTGAASVDDVPDASRRTEGLTFRARVRSLGRTGPRTSDRRRWAHLGHTR